MKNLTIAISLRVLLIITFSLNAFGILYYDSPTSFNSPRFYFMLSFWIVIGLIHLQMYKHIKNSSDGRFIMKELLLPEFNSKDEREAELTGNAAKSAFSVVLIYTPFVMCIPFIFFREDYVLFMSFIAFAFIAFASIPIAGLIAYYFSYRYHYLQ